MREDMYKVIVERPRRGGGSAFHSEARQYRNSEDVSSKIGIKKGHKHRKYLNENLNPLERFIGKNIGRPWDKVYAEIAQGIDRRNTVQEHIFSHIEQMVALHTVWEPTQQGSLSNGDCVVIKKYGWRGCWETLRSSNVALYVHPRTRLLLRNPFYESHAAKAKRERTLKTKASAQELYVVSQTLEYRLIDENWYQLKKVQFPHTEGAEKVLRWDAYKLKLVTGSWPNYYTNAKSQLSRQEIEKMKKAQQIAGLFCLTRSFYGLCIAASSKPDPFADRVPLA